MSVYGISGIYKISAPNLRYYVGQSSNVGKRWSQHLDDFRANKHTNPILQASYNKYGELALEFTVLVELPVDELDELEQLVLDECIDNPLCMNIERVVGKPRLNRKHTEETKAKMSATKLGSLHSDATKQKMSTVKKGTVPKNLEQLKYSKVHPVYGKSPDGEYCTWKSKTEAAQFFNVDRRHFNEYLNNKVPFVSGKLRGWYLSDKSLTQKV